jgi:hypothetical protein
MTRETSPAVAQLAARVLGMEDHTLLWALQSDGVTIADIRTLAASCLSQAEPDEESITGITPEPRHVYVKEEHVLLPLEGMTIIGSTGRNDSDKWKVAAADSLEWWEASAALRWRRESLRTHIRAPVLQQLWRNKVNGREEWRDVPVVVEGSAG